MITILAGISGSGKTTYAKRMAKANYRHVDCDRHGLAFFEDSVIDYINLTREERVRLIARLREKFPEAKIDCVYFEPDIELSVSRGVPIERARLQAGMFETPSREEGFSEVVKYNELEGW